ncbi:MAG: YegS/Rv2252/BmrU family lipid kinase [Bacteroidales bacterium]|nr:YegS/Rv2252/BmrU family lipid kinase [Bacteroidales bacterium]MCF6341937.1 YegS/Rv2252/BmrU family lipid kinase [Bacteroidales bacterium]
MQLGAKTVVAVNADVSGKAVQAKRKKILFIVNPFSGKKTKPDISKIIRSHIDHEKFEPEIFLTKKAGHARHLSRQAVDAGVAVVVAVGGDGTINEVASQLIHSETVLGIVPQGSGNGLARHLGIPLSAVKAVQLINKARTTTIDTAAVNNVPFVSIAGIGFDALVARKFSKNTKRGFFSYLHIITKEYRNYKPKKYELLFDDGKQLKLKAFFISFANSNQFGYNTSIAPLAKLDDGLLDVCIVQKPRIFDVPLLANLLFLKQIHKSSLVTIIPANQVIVKRSKRAVNLDGETVKLKKELTIKVNPLSLKILIPEK